MTIDERLEKLTERHEALTQSVELLRIAQEETDRRFTHVGELFAPTREALAKFHGAHLDEWVC